MKKATYANNIEIEKKKTSKAIIIFRVVSLLIIAFCLYRLFNWHQENKKNQELISELKTQIILPETQEVNILNDTNNNNENNTNTAQPETSIDFSNLINLNPDTVAWVKVNNTDIDFPVVKTDNNDYYIKHNFDKKYNSAGWIFADFRNKFDGTDKNIIIYGHNRRDGSMFSTLNNTLEESWYTNPENQIIKLYTPSRILNYQIFSIYKIKETSFKNLTSFENDETFQNYIDEITTRSIHNFEIPVTSSDKILTLYTCANNNKYRIIVHGKEIK